ncbi:MAG: hypothetical protein ACKO2P_11470, partial [Planctomycetota bacterium]
MGRSRLSLLILSAVCLQVPMAGCRSQSGSTDTAHLQELIHLHNRGIGHLENKEWKEAEAALATLAERLPQNVLAARNLAVSRVLRMVDRFSPYSESEDAAAFTEGLRLAGEAVDKYRAVAGTDDERAVAELLAGKLAAFADAPGRPRIADALKN